MNSLLVPSPLVAIYLPPSLTYACIHILSQHTHTHSRTAALAKTPALMPLARNLRTTCLVLEVMVRASSATATASSGEEATGLLQLLAKEEGELAALAVEVLHALART